MKTPAEVASGLAVILARGGSKRIPRKNVRPLGGRPLIERTVRVAVEAGCFSQVLVSTDDDEIARLAEAAGAWVPFRRPAALATDGAFSVDALLHAVEWVMASPDGFHPETVCLLQPTSPFLKAAHLQQAAACFAKGRFVSLGAMRPIRERPEWMFALAPDGKARACRPESLTESLGSLPPLFIETGAFYFIRTAHLLTSRSLYDLDHHCAWVMEAGDSLDIDTPEDWDLAEALLAVRNGEGKQKSG